AKPISKWGSTATSRLPTIRTRTNGGCSLWTRPSEESFGTNRATKRFLASNDTRKPAIATPRPQPMENTSLPSSVQKVCSALTWMGSFSGKRISVPWTPVTTRCGSRNGVSSSPVIHDNKVVVLCDVQTNSFLAVFDLADGKELWRTPRKDVPTWSTPTVAQVGNATQILVNGWHHTGSYDFATGKEIWKLDGGGDIPVPTPVVAHGFAYFTSGHGKFRPMQAIRLDAKGDITPSEVGATNAAIAWSHARQGDYMQTPIVVGDRVYGCLDNGVLSCFDAKSGAMAYSERLGSGSEGFTASPVSDGRNLYFASEVGNVFVVPADGKFSVIVTNKLGETCMASPAISDRTLFFRTREHLVAIGKK